MLRTFALLAVLATAADASPRVGAMFDVGGLPFGTLDGAVEIAVAEHTAIGGTLARYGNNPNTYEHYDRELMFTAQHYILGTVFEGPYIEWGIGAFDRVSWDDGRIDRFGASVRGMFGWQHTFGFGLAVSAAFGMRTPSIDTCLSCSPDRGGSTGFLDGYARVGFAF